MLVEQGIVPKDLGARIAEALATVASNGDRPGAARASDYLPVERDLIAIGGPDVTRLHSGRSRQDIGTTSQRLSMRDEYLSAFDRLNGVRDALLAQAQAQPNAIVPAYTVGVQAQPITFGHYVGGYAEALARTGERLREAYARLNRSPLGAAALGTSSFPVDRPRLAELLGFDGPIENSYDANQLSPIDSGVELVSLAASAALTIGGFVADVTTQYAQADPWIVLREGELTGVSSIMPQKRNPSGLGRLRAEASNLIGEANTYFFIAHNVQPGMNDYKAFANPRGQPNSVVGGMAVFLGHAEALVRALALRPDRALDEVNAEYSTTTELADTLQREADVPFRVGHHFASELVNFGRDRHLRPAEIPFGDAQRIYTEAAKAFSFDPTLPLTEAQFRLSLTAENMVASSKGLGGPQAAEVARMLAAERVRLAADRSWLEETRTRLASAARHLDESFARLRSGADGPSSTPVPQ